MAWKSQYILRLADGDVLYTANDMRRLRELFRKGGLPALRAFRTRLVRQVRAFFLVAQQIEKVDMHKASWMQLERLLERYTKASSNACNFLTPMAQAGAILAQRILEKLPQAPQQQQQAWLTVLTYPQRENEHTKEARALLHLALLRNRPKLYQRALRRHVQRFAWIGARGYRWHLAWKEQDVHARVRELLQQRKDLRKELRLLNAVRKERKQAAGRLLRRLRIYQHSRVYLWIRMAQDFAYLRTWRTDYIYGAGYHAQALFQEIVRRCGLHPLDAMYLSLLELHTLVRTGKSAVSAVELRRRKESFATLLTPRKFLIFSGKLKTQQVARAVRFSRAQSSKVQGVSAFNGKVRGTARIVFTVEDLVKVRRGDVLVAVMTFPNFVPAMEKAAAFVTDEGGILCHAAIVSREMRKPCVIGTGNATKVLKDGDSVEVDATKGIVRKLA